ncbi:hypothetical protein KEM52_001169 [Ascosphaera acerosa]|nr:hypothetical protein KEM52_001169 [Ascosphaera acerosa]
MFTRNLIGSLSASAFHLTDVENRPGIWFILQDLSVRTEGNFRLKMNFVNVGVQPRPSTSDSHATSPGGDGSGSNNDSNGNGNGNTSGNSNGNDGSGADSCTTPPSPQLNVGSAPILATVFSDMFSVFSAKKFPGVIESTPLSKCFAIQGIKIPIRKDGVKSQRVLPPPAQAQSQAQAQAQAQAQQQQQQAQVAAQAQAQAQQQAQQAPQPQPQPPHAPQQQSSMSPVPVPKQERDGLELGEEHAEWAEEQQ